MERRRLGVTGASVGTIGLGTATWGRGTDRSEAREQLASLEPAPPAPLLAEIEANAGK